MKNWDHRTSPYIEQANFFSQGVPLLNVMDILVKLVPCCPDCSTPLMHFCVERCCSLQPIFCRLCEQQLHFLHKTNQLLALFCDPERVRYESLDVGRMHDYFDQNGQQLEQCKGAANQFEIKQVVVEIRSLLAMQLGRAETNWHYRMRRCLEKCLLQGINPINIKCEFRQSFYRLNLSRPYTLPRKYLVRIDSVVKYLRQHKDLHSKADAEFIEAFTNKIMAVLEPPTYSLEVLMKLSAIQKFPVYDRNDAPYLNTPNRSGNITRHPYQNNFPEFRGSRLMLNSLQQKSNSSIVSDIELPLVRELYCAIQIKRFPKNLKSLSYDFPIDRRLPQELNISFQLPNSVVKLRYRGECRRKGSRGELTEQLLKQRPPNLKYLVLGANLDVNTTREIIELAIQNHMRVLCILSSYCSINVSRIGSREYRFEAVQQHEFAGLQRHYRTYYRKLLQIMRLRITHLYKIPSACIQTILEHLELRFETEPLERHQE